ncbi:MAG: histone deacetylase [Chloroflexaceae bacterium]|nr:histone deacetylase [Chloroflexaceae bacterium]
MTTAIVTDTRYLAHTEAYHVERAERLQAIERALEKSQLRNESDVLILTPRAASDSELEAVHGRHYLEQLQQFGRSGGGNLDPDTYMNSHSWEAAVWAAGGAVRMVEAVLNNECQNGFALVRPPGHHATPNRAMGFCLINNIAVAARYALQVLGLERVAIVDYDVHHGNGTQDIFYRDPKVLYCSTHASPYYPGTGLLDEQGDGDAQGSTLNVPLSLGVGDNGYVQIFSEVIIPTLRSWQPQLLLISAGYDAHWSDPIGPMVVSVEGYARMTQMLLDLASEVCDGKLVMLLEGGYNLDAIGACVVASLRVLLGRPFEEDTLGTIKAPEPAVDGVIQALQKRHPLVAAALGG